MKVLIRRIILFIKGFWFFLMGNLFSLFVHDRKYLKGKYFKRGIRSVVSIGWKWVYYDTLGRLFLGKNKKVPWPVSPLCTVTNPHNIIFDNNDLNNFQLSGSYFQALGAKITIGSGTYIAPNVGLITANHDLNDLDKHYEGRDIVIGNNSWIGMNSMILPGVVLGERTIVGAGSVVTKSFPDGDCVIVGNPAVVLRKLQ